MRCIFQALPVASYSVLCFFTCQDSTAGAKLKFLASARDNPREVNQQFYVGLLGNEGELTVRQKLFRVPLKYKSSKYFQTLSESETLDYTLGKSVRMVSNGFPGSWPK